MECRKDENIKNCRCTYTACPNHGQCCVCVRSHRDRGEVPGCFFTKEGEKTYDRSVQNLMKYHR
jgi:hypothetical protein